MDLLKARHAGNMKKYGIILPLLLISLLYLPFLGNAFVSDDISGIVQQAPSWTLLSAMGWPHILRLDGLFRYVVFQLFGLVPWSFRLFNILVHAGSVALVYFIVCTLTKKYTVAIITVILFAAHPLVTESVTWISGGVYPLYSFFFLLSFFLYMKASKKPLLYICSIFSFFLSLFSSEKAASLVFLFVSYEWFFGDLKKHWKKLIPYVVLSSGLMVFYIFKIGERVQVLTESANQSFSGMYNPLLQIPIAISSYIELFVWPKNLTLYHSSSYGSYWELGIRMLVTAGFLIAAVYGVVKKHQLGFWLSWVVGVLGITLLPFKFGWIVAERYAYLATVGLCVIVGMGIDILISRKRWYVVGVCLTTVVILALCTRTIVRNNDWRTQDSLWVATVMVSPDNEHSWNNMGDVYSRHGEYEKSIEAFTRATRINPQYADAYHNIGNTYLYMKKYDEAVPFFEKALSINPNLWQSYQDLAIVVLANKEYPQAISYFKKAIAISPREAVLWTNMAVVYLELGEKENARLAIERAFQIDPTNPEARNLQKRVLELP
jgi:Tfp pilus assembly protein PilF